MNTEQPKPDSRKYADLINEIQTGIIKIPKFQRDFVWSIDKTAKLLDSTLKGYPIGTIFDLANISGIIKLVEKVISQN